MSTKTQGRHFLKQWLFTLTFFACCLAVLAGPRAQAVGGDSLGLAVEYPADIRCGEPVTFTLKGTGGSGVYGYKWGGVYMKINGAYEPVLDGAAFSVRIVEDPAFSFTFYAPGTYRFDFYIYDKGNNYAQYRRATEIVTVTDPAWPTVEEVAAKLAGECLARCGTDFEKALWLHDWLLNHCDYDHSYLFDGPEGALVRGSGTCEAYHRAYVMLLNAVGIETGRVEGNYHVWTAAKLDGQWCQIDLTWDAGGGAKQTASTADDYQLHMYFGLDDNLMAAVHSEHSPMPEYPCDTLQNHYFLKTGEIDQWADPFLTQIQEKLDAGAQTFTLNIPGSNIYETDYKVMYPLVAARLSALPWTAKGEAVSLNAAYAGGAVLRFSAAPGGENGGAGDTPNVPETPDAPDPDRSRFSDVPQGAYYADAVAWAAGRGVTSGTTENTFSPDEPCTRAQMLTFLWNAWGKPQPRSSASPFADVKSGDWYAPAVCWAVEERVTAGTSPDTFSPNGPCTRAQIVTLLWNAQGRPEPEGADPFSDVSPGAYYEKAVRWAAECKITGGTGGGRFDPDAVCTRAEIVTLLYRAAAQLPLPEIPSSRPNSAWAYDSGGALG